MKFTAAIQSIWEAFRTCAMRFSLPMLYTTALAVLFVYSLLGPALSNQLFLSIGYFLSANLLLSLSLTLWHEECKRGNLLFYNAVGALLTLISSLYLYHDVGVQETRMETMLIHLSILVALLLSVFFLSFTKEDDDIASWNFTFRMLDNLSVSMFLGLILWASISLLLGSLEWLFDIKLEGKDYLTAGTLLGFYLPALLFLGRIPDKGQKHDKRPLSSPFFGNMMRYIFVPLEGLYLLVLLIYTIQILLRWELPNGKVSWLVIASMAGCIAIELGLYPIRKAEKRRSDEWIARYLPLALTPFLVLMTVGIARRFNDYGITVTRLYLLALNIWFYAVCLGLYLTHARRIRWISASLGILFLLTSSLHINFTNVTRRHLIKQIHQALVVQGATHLPLDYIRYDRLMKSLSPQEASLISSRLSYLERTFGRNTIESLVTQKKEGIDFIQYIMPEGKTGEMDRTYANSIVMPRIQIPEACTAMTEYSVYEYEKDKMGHNGVYEIPIRMEDTTIDTISIDPDTLRRLDKKMEHPVVLPGKKGICTFTVTSFSYRPSYPTLYMTGYLFIK